MGSYSYGTKRGGEYNLYPDTTLAKRGSILLRQFSNDNVGFSSP